MFSSSDYSALLQTNTYRAVFALSAILVALLVLLFLLRMRRTRPLRFRGKSAIGHAPLTYFLDEPLS